LANLYPDLPEEAIKDPGAFKVLTGGDTLTLEKKWGQPFKWSPYTKFIFSANTTPELPLEKIDKAWLSRWDIVEFIGQFEGENDIKEFHLTLRDEIPQLIALGIAAYANVRKRGFFTYQYTPEEVLIAWVSRYDTVFAFMKWAMDNGVLVKDPAARVEVRELYKYYVRFVAAVWNKRKESKKKPVGPNIFTMRLNRMGYTIERPRNVSTLIGYRLRTEQAEKLLPKEIEESAIEADWLTGEDQAEENEEDSQGETTN
jgi:phage/plasmid-associated DNA primase